MPFGQPYNYTSVGEAVLRYVEYNLNINPATQSKKVSIIYEAYCDNCHEVPFHRDLMGFSFNWQRTENKGRCEW